MHERGEVAALHPWNSALTVTQAASAKSGREATRQAALSGRSAPQTVAAPTDLARESEVRLAESSTLAVRVAYSVLRNREDAEDVAQEAFAKAYRSFSQLRDRERFRAWLVRMTWRMALDRQRSNRRRVAREDRVEAPTITSDEHEQRERAEHLWRAIDSLSEKLRMVIVLAGIQGHDIKEVAALLDLPEGTVKSRLFAARQQLKDELSWMAQDHIIR